MRHPRFLPRRHDRPTNRPGSSLAHSSHDPRRHGSARRRRHHAPRKAEPRKAFPRSAEPWLWNLAKDLEQIVNAAMGPSGFMEMAQFDLGEVLKELGDQASKSVRLVIGNPLIMKEMVKHVPDAASYAPVTVLIDERVDGVYVSYDLMASVLAPSGNVDASFVARQLDDKVLALLTAAAE